MDKIAVIYWSGTGNTEAMANSIADGIKAAGSEADIIPVSEFSKSDIQNYKKIAFGCSAMGDEVLEESEFDPFFTSIENQLGGKKVALFGSYGWGDGKWMRDWQDRVNGGSANLYDEGLMVNGTPEGAEVDTCVEFGKGFAAY